MNKESYIDNIVLKKIEEESRIENTITLSLNFTINGFIREIFTQNNWEKAYNKHDNIFRVVIKLEIKNNGHIIRIKEIIKERQFYFGLETQKSITEFG